MGVAAENKPKIKLTISHIDLINCSFLSGDILKCTPSQT
jgi:hypothetical protein